MTYDGIHHYTYDAEGNITQVDGGATATYAYNALNQRVHVATASGTVEFVFDLNGKRRSFWNGGRDATELRSQYYWGSQPIAYSDGALHFQHLDWTGTMRMQSGATGAEETQYSSYPWGDGFTDSGAGVYGGGSSDDGAYHFAALDHDYESGTDHAQFRNYSSAQGRWLAPDPYDGSYDATNPQSFNRYAYVLETIPCRSSILRDCWTANILPASLNQHRPVAMATARPLNPLPHSRLTRRPAIPAAEMIGLAGEVGVAAEEEERERRQKNL
jgi:RHS repeat-associated protein